VGQQVIDGRIRLAREQRDLIGEIVADQVGGRERSLLLELVDHRSDEHLGVAADGEG
jgi:hypothetical protein